jgi:uncharacterized membrane protein
MGIALLFTFYRYASGNKNSTWLRRNNIETKYRDEALCTLIIILILTIIILYNKKVKKNEAIPVTGRGGL